LHIEQVKIDKICGKKFTFQKCLWITGLEK
jgi:hypothetical protein